MFEVPLATKAVGVACADDVLSNRQDNSSWRRPTAEKKNCRTYGVFRCLEQVPVG